tara:strand:- start:484 stop:1008 length:525 start_codon:yes stop_codon:yes gene_type:complete
MPDPQLFKKAKAHAFQFLSYRDRSHWELAQYLKKKEYSHLVIQQTLDYLTELNYINDKRFALQWSQFKINKNKIGRSRLYLELLGKGIDNVIIEKTLNAIYEDNPEKELAEQCARKKWISLKGVEKEKKKQRLVQFMQRRGFSSDIIYQSLKTLTEPIDTESNYSFPNSTGDQD